MEHRFGQRVSTQVRVRIGISPQSFSTGHLRNLSVSGAFVQTSVRPAPTGSVRVYFDERHSHGSLKFELDAYLVRSTPDGLGLEWADSESAILLALLSVLEPSAALPGNRVQSIAEGPGSVGHDGVRSGR
jgi:DUF971 family protein